MRSTYLVVCDQVVVVDVSELGNELLRIEVEWLFGVGPGAIVIVFVFVGVAVTVAVAADVDGELQLL